MNKNSRFIIFIIGKVSAALPLSDVQKVVRAAQIAPLPGSPDILSGMINIGGSVLSVINTRKLFSLPAKALSPDDCLVVVSAAGRSMVLLVDHVVGVRDMDIQDVFRTDPLVSGIKYLGGAACQENGIVYIYDLDQFCASRDMKEIADLVDALEQGDDPVNRGTV